MGVCSRDQLVNLALVAGLFVMVEAMESIGRNAPDARVVAQAQGIGPSAGTFIQDLPEARNKLINTSSWNDCWSIAGGARSGSAR